MLPALALQLAANGPRPEQVGPVFYPPAGSKVLPLAGGKFELCASGTRLDAPSPDKLYVARFQSLPSRPDEGCAYRLTVGRADGGHRIKVDDFGRWAELTWAPAGHRFTLTDGIGSNIADCYVASVRSGRLSKVSLTDEIARSKGRPRPPETPDRSHFYVRCSRWLGPSMIAGTLSGHTDETRAHAFCHRFSYDLASGRLTWTGSLSHARALHEAC